MMKLLLRISIILSFLFSYSLLLADKKETYIPAVYLTKTGYSLTLLVDDPILANGIKISRQEKNFNEPKVSESGNAVVFEPKNDIYGELSFTIFTKNYTIVALLRTCERQNEIDKQIISYLEQKKEKKSISPDEEDKLQELLSYRGNRFPDIKQKIELKKEYKNNQGNILDSANFEVSNKFIPYDDLISEYSQIITLLDKDTKNVYKKGNLELIVNGMHTIDEKTYLLFTLHNMSNINYKLNRNNNKFAYLKYSGFFVRKQITNDETINSKIITKIEPLEIKANSKAYLLYILQSFGFESDSYLKYILKEKSGTRNFNIEFGVSDV